MNHGKFSSSSGKSLTIANIDKIPPTLINVLAETVTGKVVQVIANGESDTGGSGLASAAYAFKLSTDSSWSSWQASNSWTKTGLKANTNYTIQAKVRDVAGNESSIVSVNVTTLVEEKEIVDMFDETGTEDGMLHTGDYVEYTPNGASYTVTAKNSGYDTDQTISRDTSLKWRVLDVKDGKLRLISELPTGGIPTTSILYLKGANGYNNAVYLLDELCKTLYSGTKGTAKSLKIEDIEQYLLYNYTAYTNGTYKYGTLGTVITNSAYRYYPNIWPSEKYSRINGAVQSGTLGLSEQTSVTTGSTTATTSITPTETCWVKSMVKSDFTKEIYYSLFIKNGTQNYDGYWLASRCVEISSNIALFCVSIVSTPFVSISNPYGSNNGVGMDSYRMRPVITLNSGISIDDSDSTRDGSPGKPWQLK